MNLDGGITVKGLDEVLGQLRKEIAEIKPNTKKGLISAAFEIQREAQLRCPVQFGNLHASAFVVWGMGGTKATPVFEGDDKAQMTTRHQEVVAAENKEHTKGKVSVGVGFSASYAIYVHENLMAKHYVGEAKFLQHAIEQNKDKIVKLIKEEF